MRALLVHYAVKTEKKKALHICREPRQLHKMSVKKTFMFNLSFSCFPFAYNCKKISVPDKKVGI